MPKKYLLALLVVLISLPIVSCSTINQISYPDNPSGTYSTKDGISTIIFDMNNLTVYGNGQLIVSFLYYFTDTSGVKVPGVDAAMINERNVVCNGEINSGYCSMPFHYKPSEKEVVYGNTTYYQ